MTITDQIRAKISSSMPAGYRRTVALQTGYSQSMVSKVWREGQPNAKIVKAILALAAKTRTERANEQKEILRLADNFDNPRGFLGVDITAIKKRFKK